MKDALQSMLDRSCAAQLKLGEGTPQHTLQRNRIAALKTALALLDGQGVKPEEVQAARAPIASLISKSEKSLTHFTPDRWQYKMLEKNLEALRHIFKEMENICNS